MRAVTEVLTAAERTAIQRRVTERVERERELAERARVRSAKRQAARAYERALEQKLRAGTTSRAAANRPSRRISDRTIPTQREAARQAQIARESQASKRRADAAWNVALATVRAEQQAERALVDETIALFRAHAPCAARAAR